MKTALMLPFILINGAAQLSQPDISQEYTVSGLTERVHNAIFQGCSSPVLDTRLPSQILFDTHVGEVGRAQADAMRGDAEVHLFIARCGEEFVLFNGQRGSDSPFEDVLYLRFAEGSYELVDQAWR